MEDDITEAEAQVLILEMCNACASVLGYCPDHACVLYEHSQFKEEP